MSTITTEQWSDIESELSKFFCQVTFTLMATEIKVLRVRTSENTHELAVYIDGVIRPICGWPNDDKFNPLCESIWKKKTRHIWPPKKQKEIQKCFGKREAKKRFPNLEEKSIWYEPWFPKAKQLVSTFKKVQGLSLVSIGVP